VILGVIRMGGRGSVVVSLGGRVLFQGEVGVAWFRGGCLCFWGVFIGGSLCYTGRCSSSLALFVLFGWVRCLGCLKGGLSHFV
jgi:hypothetical protein